MTIVVKRIKPKRLKEDAMRLALLNPMRDFGKEIKKEFEETTKTWDHKVNFEILRSISSKWGTVEVAVLTDDEIYGYVNEGTRPHIIRPKKRGGKLVFKWGGPGSYAAKTTPGVIGSTSGGQSGSTVAFPYVNHPGTKARNFSKIIKKKMEPRFKKKMEKAMAAAAIASGHAMK